MGHGLASLPEQPPGWHTVTPRIFAADAAGLVEFMRDVFGATGAFDGPAPAEMHIGDSIVMVSDTAVRSAMPAALYVYVNDVEACFNAAAQARATIIEPPRILPYGDRRATFEDPWGNIWQVAQPP